jgi:ubiquitin
MQIFITRMTGKTITIDTSAGDTILNIKEKFQDKEGIPPESTGLFFGGSELEDDKTLADYHIEKETMLTMIERVAATPLQTVAGAAATSDMVAALTAIASSIASAPPTITLVKMELIAAVQDWRTEHTGEYITRVI